MKVLALILWTIGVAIASATVAVNLQPPSPIKYRIELREKPASMQSCKELLKKQLKGV